MKDERPLRSGSLLAAAPLVLVACVGSPLAPTGAASRTRAASPPAMAPTPRVTPAPTGAIGEGQIVFEDWMINHSRHQLWIDDLDGSGARPLIHSMFDDARPAISPDGKTVLFERYGDGDDKVMLVNADGSNVRNLADGVCGLFCEGDTEGDGWSPDGTQIVIQRAFEPFVGEEPSNVSLWIINLDGSGTTEITHHRVGELLEDYEPDWSADGKRIAFLRKDFSPKVQRWGGEREAIFTIGVDGGDERQVTPWKLGSSEPAWSPDGSRIAFDVPGVTFKGGEQNIYTMRPDGSDVRQVTAHLEMGDDNLQATFDPCWSPDGSQLIFTHFPSTNGLADLYVVNADGSDLHVFAPTRLINESHANWGVDPLP
jgi:Tol biopolymer transport system component